jgi:hypothetical protein
MAVMTNPILVKLERPTGTPFGEIMNEVRSWLDSQKIEPIDFKPVVSSQGIGFEISFRAKEQAELFQRTFG